MIAPAEQMVPTDAYNGFAPLDETALAQAVYYVTGCGVPGDVAEFGCYEGRSASVIAKAFKYAINANLGMELTIQQAARKFWLFDSFEGFPKVDNPVDNACPHIVGEIWGPGIAKGGSPEKIARLLSEHIKSACIVVKPGWFKDTVKDIPANTKFALLHMDCDYYESTLDALIPLFHQRMLSDGCTILFDDWYCNAGSPKFGQQKAWRDLWDAIYPLGAYAYSDWGGYGTTGRRFIVHER